MTARPVRPANRYWTWAFITAVTVLIWVWAAGQTRDQQSMYARVRFVAPDPSGWTIEPVERAVTLKVEGSALSIQSIASLVKLPIDIPIKAEPGDQQCDLVEILSGQTEISRTGIDITAVEPPVAEISVDRIELVPVPIKVTNLSTVQTDGDIKVEPAEAMVAMPSRLHRREPSLVVNATLPDGMNLEPGPKTAVATLRLPETLRTGGAKIISPVEKTAQVSFTVRSLTGSIRLDQVNVQIAGPPEDYNTYSVDVVDETLRQVTVSGDHELIRRIEKDEVKVFAMVHLTSEDKDRRVDSKPATFIAVTPEGTIVTLKGSVGGATDPPVIHLRITPRASVPPPS